MLKLNRSFGVKRFLPLGFIIIFAAVAGAIIFQASAAPRNSNMVSLSLDPSSQRVSNGTVLTVAIWENSNNIGVNAVQADLKYSADKFDFVSIDSAGSAFEIEAQAKGGDGTITIGRGHVGSLTGKQLVAKINLRAKSADGKANISFTSRSKILKASDSSNILQQSKDASYRLSAYAGTAISKIALMRSKV